MYDYFKIIEEIGEAHDESEKLRGRCKALEEQLHKEKSIAVLYSKLYEEAKRVVGEDALSTLMYNEDLDE